ncbi:MAG: ATPase [Bacteroidota bacterium]
MRIALTTDGVSIWSAQLFERSATSQVQDFLSRIFSVEEVESVELERNRHFGRIRYAALANPRRIWRKLSRALKASSADPIATPRGQLAAQRQPLERFDVELLNLDGAGDGPVYVGRVGGALSTWRVVRQSDTSLHLWHPAIRRREVVFRLEEELASILGVVDFRITTLTASVVIRFDKTALAVEHLARELEKAWPRLLDGLDGPPSSKRLVAAGALLALASVGQYLVPGLRPVALVGVLIYGFPNVIKALRQLTRGQVGIYAQYSAGMALLLISRMPFTAALFAVLMQLWPRLAHRKITKSQRRLFARQRRRQVWARVQRDGAEIEVGVDELRADDRIVVRKGETVPADGVVQSGTAVVVEGPAFTAGRIEQKVPGDSVGFGAVIREGRLVIGVERTGSETTAGHVATLLPHAPLRSMPSLLEAERIANRNAKPILALAGISLALTRRLRPSQALIRLDFATAPRLSAQLSAFRALAEGSRQGVYFSDPAALDRLAAATVVVFDESAGLERRCVEVAAVETVKGVPAGVVAAHAAAALGRSGADRSVALATFLSKADDAYPKAGLVMHQPGVARFRDEEGRTIEVVTAHHAAASNIEIPREWRRPPSGASTAANEGAEVAVRNEDPALRPLWVVRNGQLVGVVSFARAGEMIGKQVVAAAKAQQPRARFVYLSRRGEAEARAAASEIGIDFSYGDLDPQAKAALIRGVGRPAVWVGDGIDPAARDAIAASTVSVSVTASGQSRQDVANILVLPGLAGVPSVLAIGQAHSRRLAHDYRTVYSFSLLGAGGAFLARLGALHTGLLSNIGTGIIYARHARALDKLAAAAASR